MRATTKASTKSRLILGVLIPIMVLHLALTISQALPGEKSFTMELTLCISAALCAIGSFYAYHRAPGMFWAFIAIVWTGTLLIQLIKIFY